MEVWVIALGSLFLRLLPHWMGRRRAPDGLGIVSCPASVFFSRRHPSRLYRTLLSSEKPPAISFSLLRETVWGTFRDVLDVFPCLRFLVKLEYGVLAHAVDDEVCARITQDAFRDYIKSVLLSEPTFLPGSWKKISQFVFFQVPISLVFSSFFRYFAALFLLPVNVEQYQLVKSEGLHIAVVDYIEAQVEELFVFSGF